MYTTCTCTCITLYYCTTCIICITLHQERHETEQERRQRVALEAAAPGPESDATRVMNLNDDEMMAELDEMLEAAGPVDEETEYSRGAALVARAQAAAEDAKAAAEVQDIINAKAAAAAGAAAAGPHLQACNGRGRGFHGQPHLPSETSPEMTPPGLRRTSSAVPMGSVASPALLRAAIAAAAAEEDLRM